MKCIEIMQHKGHKFLFIDNYLWMWDTPQEIRLQKNLAKKAHGNVLVVGYGFGIVNKFLMQNPRVSSVTTVEKHKQVIEKMKKLGKIYGTVIISDFYKLPTNRKYDSIIGDIWPDIDDQFLRDYVKFKNKAKTLLKRNGTIIAWGKDYFEYLLKKKKNLAS